jgi:hypothetical protein
MLGKMTISLAMYILNLCMLLLILNLLNDIYVWIDFEGLDSKISRTLELIMVD